MWIRFDQFPLKVTLATLKLGANSQRAIAVVFEVAGSTERAEWNRFVVRCEEASLRLSAERVTGQR